MDIGSEEEHQVQIPAPHNQFRQVPLPRRNHCAACIYTGARQDLNIPVVQTFEKGLAGLFG
jgi:hypothetical protein